MLPPSLSSSATVRVAADDDAAQGPERLGLRQHLGRDHLADHARELVGGAAAPDEVVPLVVGRQEAKLGAQELAVELALVHEAVERVEAAGGLVPAVAQRPDGVRVAVEVDDRLLGVGDAVLAVHQHPGEVAEVVEPGVLGPLDGTDPHERLAQVLHPRALVVGGAAQRIAALVDRLVHVVGGDADRLLEDLDRERTVRAGELGDLGFQGHRWGLAGWVAGSAFGLVEGIGTLVGIRMPQRGRAPQRDRATWPRRAGP